MISPARKRGLRATSAPADAIGAFVDVSVRSPFPAEKEAPPEEGGKPRAGAEPTMEKGNSAGCRT